MKLDSLRTAPTVAPAATPLGVPPGTVKLPQDPITDCWNPGPVGPQVPDLGKLDDFFFKQGLKNKGSEDLDAERNAQEQRAAQALKQFPPDLATYRDANEKIQAIDAEKTGRALEQRGFEVGLKFKDDKALRGALESAEAELGRVLDDPKASEADRERARARLDAVLEEMDRRD